MTRRQSSFAYAALILGVVAFASSFARPTSGQQGALSSTGVGRYQLASGGASNNHLYVIDTATGRIWSRFVPGGTPQETKWVDCGSPVAGK